MGRPPLLDAVIQTCDVDGGGLASRLEAFCGAIQRIDGGATPDALSSGRPDASKSGMGCCASHAGSVRRPFEPTGVAEGTAATATRDIPQRIFRTSLLPL